MAGDPIPFEGGPCRCALCNDSFRPVEQTPPDLHRQLWPIYLRQLGQEVPNRLYGATINHEGDAV